MVPTWVNQLLQQLLIEKFDNSPVQYRTNKHIYERVYLICCDKMTAVRT